MFSHTLEYALRAVTCLAQHPGCSMTTLQVADLTQVPRDYLSKILRMLSREGLVKSRRGRHGGHALRIDPAELSVSRVADAVEPFRPILRCPLRLASHGRNLCPLHRRLDEAGRTARQILADTMVADLLVDPVTGIEPLRDAASKHCQGKCGG